MPALFDLPHTDARALLASGAPVYLGVNPVEYHGPHLSLHNDRLVSRALAERMHPLIGRSDWPFVWAEDLELGVEPVPGLGTRASSYPAARAAITDACRALAELGAQRVIVSTFHGSPLHNLAIEDALEELRTRGVMGIAPLSLLLDALIEPPAALRARFETAVAPIEDAEARRRLIEELPLDFHAGFFETSLALALAPSSVSAVHRSLPPCPRPTPKAEVAASARALRAAGRHRLALELDFIAAGLGWYAVRPFPGYTGQPHLASAASGEIFASIIAELYASATRAYFLEGAKPPKPPAAWIRWLTLGGRVAPPLDVGAPA